MTLSPRIVRVVEPAVALVAAPAKQLVTVSEAKAFARIDHTADDAVLLPMLIEAATRKLQDHCRRSRWITQTVDVAYSVQPGLIEPLPLPVGPVQSITSVKVYALDGSSATVDAADYALDVSDPRSPKVQLVDTASWPLGTRDYAPLVVRCIVGYGTNETDAPEEARVACCIAVAKWYDDRMPGPLPQGAIDAVHGLVSYRLEG